MSSVSEEWVPTEAELPADHWSKSPEWLEYKRKQAQIDAVDPLSKNTLAGFQKVGTVSPERRKLSTHDIQMEACKVEWVDPNPTEETPATIIAQMKSEYNADLDKVCATIAEELHERLAKVTDPVMESDAQAG